MPHAETISTARPMPNFHRVSSHDLYQSISVLRLNRFEKNVLQRDRQHVDRSRAERARLRGDLIGAAGGENRENAALTLDALCARRPERGPGGLAVEHRLHAPVAVADVVEGARDDCP